MNRLLSLNQAGFRKKHSTTDNIFILHLLSECLKKKNNVKLFCAFIDFKEHLIPFGAQFSGVNVQLLKYNIHENFVHVIKSVYENMKSCLSIKVKNLYFPLL